MLSSQSTKKAQDETSGELFGKNAELARYLLPEDPNNAQANAVWAHLKPALPDILKDFYTRIKQTPALASKLGNEPGKTSQLNELQSKHWEHAFSGRVDRKLEQEARKIGAAHVRIGMSSDWFIAGYGRVLMDAIPVILKAHRFTPQRATGALQVLVARLFMDMAVANEAYSSQMTDHEAHEWREDNDYQNLKTISASMTDLNEVTLNLAMLTDSTRRASSSTESVAAAVEELVASIRQLSETSQSASQDASDTNSALEVGVRGVAQARSAIMTVSGAAERSSESLTSLQQAAGEINSVMTVIQSIADQTNLLALNATIEAARAGDAGRGFAVVASEVKQLANQTASATEDVAKRIRTLQQGIDRINQHFAETKSAIDIGESTLNSANNSIETAGRQMNSVAIRMSEVASILDQQDSSATEISGHVSGMAEMANVNASTLEDVAHMLQNGNDRLGKAAQQWFRNTSGRSLCEMAKIDHVLFKKRVVDTILGRGKWPSNEVPDNHGCRLGKWYDTIKNPELRKLDAFIRLNGPHERVHKAAKSALAAHEKGDAAVALEAVRALDIASREVIDLLNKISEWLHEQESISERRKRDRKPVFGESARLHIDGELIETNVLDEAGKGLGLEGINLSHVGQEFDVEFKGKKKGIVRWSNGKRGGLEFKP